MSTTNFAINRALDAIKQAQFELNHIDLRTLPVTERQPVKDARDHLVSARTVLTKSR